MEEKAKGISPYRQYKTYDKIFKSFASVYPDDAAIYYGERIETWKEIDERTNALANALLDLGYKKGDNCALLMPNCPEYMECITAGFKTGILMVSGVNYRYVPKEMQYVIDSTDSKCLILDEDYVDRINQVRPELKKLKNCIVVGKNVPGDMLSYEDLIEKYPKTDPKFDWEIRPEDESIIIVTGGTTGRPKGVLYGHEDALLSVGDAAMALLLGNIDEFLGHMREDSLRVTLNALIPGTGGISPLLIPIIKSGVMRDLMKRPTTILILDAVVHSLMGRGFMRRLTHNMIFFPASPLFHSAAAYAMHVSFFGLGTPIVFLTKKEGLDVKEFWQTVDERKVGWSVVVGDAFAKPLLEHLDDHIDEYDFSHYLLFVNSGAGLTRENKEKLTELIPHLMFTDTAGATEVGIKIGAMANVEVADKADTMKFGRIGILNKTTYVINPETGKEVSRGTGEVGTLHYIARPFHGYYGDPKKTAEVSKIIDGRRYWDSDDGATVDADGSVRMYGRTKGIINTGGEKVYPEEIEEVLKAHPKIEAMGLTGVPDERWGEAVTAVVKLREGEKMTEEEVKEYCEGKMARFKIPKHVFFVPDLPMSATGKAERPKLKYMARAIAEEKRIPTMEELDREFAKTGRKI